MSWFSMLHGFILLLAFVTGIVLLMLPEKNQRLRTSINLVSAFLTIVMIVVLIVSVYSGHEFKLVFPLLPDINLVLHADPMTIMFVGLSGVLWFVTTIYAIGYFKNAKHRSRFFGFFSLCVFATLGIALAGNLITFLIFYELLTLVTYPLVVHKGNAASMRAGRIYLRYTMIGGAVLIVGVVWLKSIAGALDFSSAGNLAGMTQLPSTELTVIFALLIIGFGVKAALVPFHGWLPAAMAAPAPVSSLLHAVAVVKAGAFGILRVIYDVYGFEFAESLGVLFYVSVATSITIVFGSVVALYQDDLKKRLAYSTVSQVSYIALGASIGGPLAATGAVAHLVHQGVMKITMFFSAGNFAEALHVHKVSELDGIGRRMPLTMTALTIAILGMIGIPPLAGFVTKWYLGAGAIAKGEYWVLVILAISSLLNAMYLLPIIYRAWFKAPKGEWHETSPPSRFEIHWMLLLPPLVTITFAILAGLFAGSELSPLVWAKFIAEQEFNTTALASTAISTVSSYIPWVIISAPLLFAGLLFIFRHNNINPLITLTPLCALPAIYFAYISIEQVFTTSYMFFGSKFIFDEMSHAFLMLAGVLWFMALVYARFYITDVTKIRTFFIFMLLSMSGCFGLVISADPFGFISFFTLMSLSAFVLVIHLMTKQAREASKLYIKWAILGEVLVFTGFCLVDQFSELSVNGEMAELTMLLIALGFGAKVGLFGMHWWLPKAHPVAPIPASALLSGFMVKAGIIGWIRFMPQDTQPVESVGYLLVALGLLGAFIAAIKGLFEHNPKALLAYSTVSQMGVLSLAFGASMLLPNQRAEIITAMVLYSIHHGLTKSALFFSVGIAPLLQVNKSVKYLAYFAVLIPGLALVGLPLLSGSYVKLQLKAQLVGIEFLPILLSIGTVFTGLLIIRFTTLMVQLSKANSHHNQKNTETPEEEGNELKKLYPLLLVCLINVLIVILWPMFYFESLSFSTDTFISLFWPIVLAVAIGTALTQFLDSHNKNALRIATENKKSIGNDHNEFTRSKKTLGFISFKINRLESAINISPYQIASQCVISQLRYFSGIKSSNIAFIVLVVMGLILTALVLG